MKNCIDRLKYDKKQLPEIMGSARNLAPIFGHSTPGQKFYL